MSRGLVCAAIAWAHTHPAEGLMRRLVEASRVRILRLSVAGPGGLVESRPELHMELVMTTRGCSWIPLATRRLIPSWRSPHRTPRISVTAGTHRRLAHVPADVRADPERGEPRQSPRRSTSPPGATFATDQTINPDARRHRDARGADCTLGPRWTCPSRSSGTRSTGTNTVGAVAVTPACPHVDQDADAISSRAPGRPRRWPSSAGVCRSPSAYPRRTAWRMPR